MRRKAVFLVLAATLLAAACSAELSPGATVLQSIPTTHRAHSARVSYSATFDIATAPAPVEMTGEGAFDYARHEGRMTFDMSQILQQEGGAPEGSGRVDMIFEGVVLYMRMPFLTQIVTEQRPWLRLDLEAARRAGRPELAQLVQLGQSDPTQLLELLNGATKDVEAIGEEELRGTQTTHYTMTLDLRRAVEKASAETRSSIASLVARSGSPRLAADVWIDEEGRMRRMTYVVVLATSDGDAPPNSMTVTMELYEFGVDISVQPPPADQVVDLLSLLEQPSQGGS
jgi:hypothetical protein